MIEVERKFKLTPELAEKLIAGAKFFKEIIMHDTYYDDANYSLSTSDRWLRRRNDSWELKIPAHTTTADRLIDQYREIEDESEIRKELNLSLNQDLMTDLQSAGITPFCSYTTTRRKHRRGDLIIDVDVLDYGYEVTEIEKMVEREDQVQDAIEEIDAFARELGLDPTLVRDKTTEYLRRHSPAHYKKLQDAGVI